MLPAISVIVPALDEAPTLAATLASARVPGVELIVVDGGSADATREVARRAGAHVIEAPRGRARQMNAGAGVARAARLLFLHADTRLPPDYPRQVVAALDEPTVVWGRFDVRLDADTLVHRALGWLISQRSRRTAIATGDQAIFVRATAFRRVGGFEDIPLMEDVALCRALRHEGGFCPLRAAVVTSARRWQRHGLWRTVFLMWSLRLAYWAGVSPVRLARVYRDAR